MRLIEKIKVYILKNKIQNLKISDVYTYKDLNSGKIFNNLENCLEELKYSGRRFVNIRFYTNNSDNEIKFEFQTTPYCCGLLEIGYLDIELQEHNIENYKEAALILDKFIEINFEKHFILNTNGINPSATYENVLPFCNYFQEIRTFFNNSSGNTVTLWMSLNK